MGGCRWGNEELKNDQDVSYWLAPLPWFTPMSKRIMKRRQAALPSCCWCKRHMVDVADCFFSTQATALFAVCFLHTPLMQQPIVQSIQETHLQSTVSMKMNNCRLVLDKRRQGCNRHGQHWSDNGILCSERQARQRWDPISM